MCLVWTWNKVHIRRTSFYSLSNGIHPPPHHARIIIHFSNLVVVHSITIVEKFDVIANVWPLAIDQALHSGTIHDSVHVILFIFIGHTDLSEKLPSVFCVVLVFLLVWIALSLVWHFPISVGLRSKRQHLEHELIVSYDQQPPRQSHHLHIW